jgi:peptidoglycan hydrolase-like protein with peptidoglycan-binding domain
MNIRYLRKGIPAAVGAAALAGGLLAAAPAGAATASHAVKAAPVASARNSAGSDCSRYYFGYGSGGNCVADIQAMLNDQTRRAGYAGYRGSYLSIDGNFGSRTYGQVLYFQRVYHLGADGWVGPVTWGALCMAARGSNDIRSFYDAGC